MIDQEYKNLKPPFYFFIFADDANSKYHILRVIWNLVVHKSKKKATLKKCNMHHDYVYIKINKRRRKWKYPEEVKPIAEYWLQTATPNLYNGYKGEFAMENKQTTQPLSKTN